VCRYERRAECLKASYQGLSRAEETYQGRTIRMEGEGDLAFRLTQATLPNNTLPTKAFKRSVRPEKRGVESGTNRSVMTSHKMRIQGGSMKPVSNHLFCGFKNVLKLL
jgi:hypothetical protein